MASINEHLCKLREERIAREKARIEKLRELNLKKYNKAETAPTPRPSTVPSSKHEPKTINIPKNNFHVNGTTKRPITVPTGTSRKSVAVTTNSKPTNSLNNTKISNSGVLSKIVKTETFSKKTDIKIVNKVTNVTRMTHNVTKTSDGKNDGHNMVKTLEGEVQVVKNHVEEEISTKTDGKRINVVANASKGDGKTDNAVNKIKNMTSTNKNMTRHFNGSKTPKGDGKVVNNNGGAKIDPKFARKSFAPRFEPSKSNPDIKINNSRKSLQPLSRIPQNIAKANPNRQSVFERLYQPKMAVKKPITDAEKLKTDPDFLKKVIKNTGLILNKRHTTFEPRKIEPPVRRSISAVHLKRISKSELSNCIHKWSSIGEKLDKEHLQDINEDASVKEDKIVSAIKSERKKVKFLTPIPFNFNTPKPEELQARLKNWLQKRGKSLDSYHHLQCFGIHHMAPKVLKPLNLEPEEFDDEDKENQPLESDSDNDSYDNNMNNKECDVDKDKWRRASAVSESVDFNESHDTTLSSTNMHYVDELLVGALNDLTELLREGFEWEQCARWLRALRTRWPAAPLSAQYWECRAALEERRGDLPASVHCWQEAIAKGTEHSVVDANLDQLLDKFMQLKISPNSGQKRQPDPKMVDVKNVFKSTLIRFAVQQAKLRQSQDQVKYTVTPVRRSGRLSVLDSGRKGSARRPVQVYPSVAMADTLGQPLVFVPNRQLHGTP